MKARWQDSTLSPIFPGCPVGSMESSLAFQNFLSIPFEGAKLKFSVFFLGGVAGYTSTDAFNDFGIGREWLRLGEFFGGAMACYNLKTIFGLTW